ncbi:MAG: D-TA family PLP-dependent enzyme [Luteitalea sp.]|nr:D-TA family PLP-dependent enzyme [Luteitalea sp.]
MPSAWYSIENVAEVPSPALVVYPDRVEENIRRMIRLAGGVDRLRPHIKTSKLPEVIQMQMDQGITKFKCATIAEAEMAAACGAPDVLLAYQPVGPNVSRLVQLVQTSPKTTFSTLADDEGTIHALSNAAVAAGLTLNLFLDIDCGMHRSGVAPGSAAAALYRLIARSPGLAAAGLHAYDGHIRDTDVDARARACDEAFDRVQALRAELRGAGLPVPVLVAGGSPTFPIHARRSTVECSPGTAVFWDLGYTRSLPDLDFLPAALLLTRVISKPGHDLLCVDLGHKAVASEGPHPRVELLDLPDTRAVGHSEEHLTLETPRAAELPVGASFYGIPWHVCPTVALHDHAVVVRDGRAQERWRVVGRTRQITI